MINVWRYIFNVRFTMNHSFIIIFLSIFLRIQAAEFWRVYHAFRRHHLRGSPLALQRLHELLYAYGNASATGIINKRRRWDFPGSFHFVGTIVSTIGKKCDMYNIPCLEYYPLVICIHVVAGISGSVGFVSRVLRFITLSLFSRNRMKRFLMERSISAI